ncbi:hypothetical protein CXB77_01770 [Chromatium okenii]|uniref:Uncharacterized protein n=1 Tax=Chromatium okenii TaxID=61644 RepID=A0A2S7XUN2_9GAMM|nr:hypothetical protein CXB77_01770 [Chromatium okenii]
MWSISQEIFVLTTALKNKVTDELLKNSAGIPPTLLSARLIKRLEDDAALNSEAAHWAVESWMLALDIITQPLPNNNFSIANYYCGCSDNFVGKSLFIQP